MSYMYHPYYGGKLRAKGARSSGRVAHGKYIASMLPRDSKGRFMRMKGPRTTNWKRPKGVKNVKIASKSIAKKITAAKKAVAAVKRAFKAKRVFGPKRPPAAALAMDIDLLPPSAKKRKVGGGYGYGYGMYL